MEKYIIEREDYLTVEEYNKLKSKLDEIYDLRFFRKSNEIDILDTKHKLDYYKDKLINVQYFDEHQYFRDTYDVIDNLK